jgi:hypothetical protein
MAVAKEYSSKFDEGSRRSPCLRRFSLTTRAPQHPALTLSPISEPPLDSQILEKPCTVVLVESNDYPACGNHHNTTQPLWRHTFQTKIPTECGMSFAYMTSQSHLKVSEYVHAMKSSDLPRLSDAVLVTRGWFSSLCALYYLESLHLQGVVMVDPLPFQKGDACHDDSLIQLILRESAHRLEGCPELMLEPNAVPMLVVSTIPEPTWVQAAKDVAARHSDPDGPYGNVPMVSLYDLGHNDKRWYTIIESDNHDKHETEASIMIRLIDQWIDEEVL